MGGGGFVAMCVCVCVWGFYRSARMANVNLDERRVRPPFCLQTATFARIRTPTHTHTHTHQICGSSKYDAEVCMTAIANGCRRVE